MIERTNVVEFYRSGDQWSWRTRAPNGKIICTPGERFISRRNAENNFADVCAALKNPSTRREVKTK